MQMRFRLSDRPRVVGLALALFAALPAAAQTAPASTEFDPATADVAGVTLGMTPDQAIASLKNFDPEFEITKKYLTGSGLSYALDGHAMQDIPEPDRSISYFDDLSAIKGTPKVACTNGADGIPQCHNSHADDQETIKVWFSRTPGQERVIGVQRDKIFNKDPKPPIASLKAGMFSKYPKEQITYERKFGSGDTIGWLFDSKRKILSSSAAKSKGSDETEGLPRTVWAGGGICLNVVFSSNNRNDEIADRFLITLYDADALYKSVAQSKTVTDALKAQSNAKEVEKSLKNPGQTKF